MKSRPRIGIVGIGFGQRVLVPAFAAEPECEVSAICATGIERARRAAGQLGLPKAFGRWEDLVSDPDIDAVAIATPPSVQPAIALAALANGKHVFCEKPLSTSLEDAGKMLDAARGSGLANVVDFEFPEIRAWKEAKAILDSGALGQLRHGVASWQIETYATRMGLHSWKTDASMGGGTLNAFISHSFYYLEWLLGPARRIGARLFTPAAAHGDATDVLWLEHQGGVSSSLCVSTGAFLGSGHRVAIYGQQGTLVLDNPTSDYINGFSLWHGTRDTNRLECVLAPPDEGTAETDGRIGAVNSLVRRFLRWVREGVPATPDIGDGYRVQKLLDAALRSNAADRGIEVK